MQIAENKEMIRQQVARIQAHPLFVRSTRVRRFLQFTIESCLSGRAGELKEYVLAVDVFDRPVTHDPRLDPIVRVEARRVRAKLRAYYLSDGAHDPVIIDYPRGSYVPQFRLRHGPAEHERPALIAVLPFAAPGSASCARFAEGLTREVIHELDRSDSVRVFSGSRRGRLRTRIEALLTGTVSRTGPRVRVTAELLNTGSDQHLWSARFESAPSDPLAAQKQIAFATAHALSLHFHRR